jgi:hypothetical protein
MNTVNLQIALPNDVFQAIERYGLGKNINDFVLDAIRLKINTGTDSISEILKEGYIASSKEDNKISADFCISDLENWD